MNDKCIDIRCFRIQIKERKGPREEIRRLFHTLCTVISIWIGRVKTGRETNRKIKQILRDIEIFRNWCPGKQHLGQAQKTKSVERIAVMNIKAQCRQEFKSHSNEIILQSDSDLRAKNNWMPPLIASSPLKLSCSKSPSSHDLTF